MKNSIKNLNRFSVEHSYSKNESETNTFATLEEAEKAYNDIANSILSDTNSLENSHWRNNTEGLSCEIRELKEITVEELENLKDAEDENEQMEIWTEILSTHSERLKTKITFLSDEFDETLGKDGEFVVKEKEIAGATYGTYFGAKPECVLISEIAE